MLILDLPGIIKYYFIEHPDIAAYNNVFFPLTEKCFFYAYFEYNGSPFISIVKEHFFLLKNPMVISYKPEVIINIEGLSFYHRKLSGN